GVGRRDRVRGPGRQRAGRPPAGRPGPGPPPHPPGGRGPVRLPPHGRWVRGAVPPPGGRPAPAVALGSEGVVTPKPIVIVLGILGRTPLAGVAWQVLHYLEGLRRLGFDVYYVEDTGAWPYDPDQNTLVNDCRYAVAAIARLMAWCGLEDRWAYRAGSEGGEYYGLSEARVADLFRTADVLINLTAATVL